MSNHTRSLFRQEALEYQKTHWMGQAMLIPKFPAYIIVMATGLFAFVVISFVTLGTYTRRISITGETITFPHPIDIHSSYNGYVTKIFVKVADKVQQGTPLYQIDVDRITEFGSLSDRKALTIKKQIEQTNQIIEKISLSKTATLQNLNQQIDYYNEVVDKTEDILKDIKEGVDFIRVNMVDYDRYKEMGLINKDQQNNQRYTFYQHQSTYQNLHSQHINNMLQVSNLKSEVLIKSSDFDNQISQHEYQREELMRQLSEVEADRHIIIKSPIDAKVESLTVTTGQMISAEDNLLQLKPLDEDSQLYIVMWVPNDAIPFVIQGDKINIRYAAFPHEKYGQFLGEVESISSIPASPKELAYFKSSPANNSKLPPATYYKAVISFNVPYIEHNQRKVELTSGMQAEATLFLETRPIYQWMFTPFYNIKKSISGVVHE